jgi:hypothetical protein
MSTTATHPYRQAFLEKDLEAMRAQLADDVSFHSPVLGEPGFEGRESVMTLFGVVFDAVKDLSYTHEYGDAEACVLVGDAKVLGEPIKVTNLLEFDSDGKIREIWVMARPLTGLAAIAEAMGGGLAARQGDAARGAVRVATKPLRGLASLTERVGGRIVARLNRETA